MLACPAKFLVPVIWTAAILLQAQSPEPLYVKPGQLLEMEKPLDNHQLLVAWNGGLMAPVSAEGIIVPEQGTHWLAMANRDAAGNMSPIQWWPIVADDTAPAAVIQLRPAPVSGEGQRQWVPGDSRAVVQAQDEASGVAAIYMRYNGNDLMADGNEAMVALNGSEETTVLAWSKDRAGNQSKPVSATVWVDSSPPTGDLTLTGPHIAHSGGWICGPAAALQPGLQDTGSGLAKVTAYLNGQPVPQNGWNGPWPEGDHQISLEAQDRTGNTASLGPWPFIVDLSGPVIQWRHLDKAVTGADGQHYFPVLAVFEASAEDAVAGLDSLVYSTDQQNWRAVENTIGNLNPGFFLRATDVLGNTTVEQVSWRVDNQPPQIKLATGGQAPLTPHYLGPPLRLNKIHRGGFQPFSLPNGVSIQPLVSDSQSGLSETRYTLNSTIWEPLPQTLRINNRGEYRLVIEASDQMGNRQTAIWFLDVLAKQAEPRTTQKQDQ